MTVYNQTAFIQTEVILRWADFKAMAISKSLFMQVANGTESYQVFAFDGPIAYYVQLYKAPYSSLVGYDPDYSQAQNDIDRVDFENSYLATTNQVISSDNRSVPGTISTNGDIVFAQSRGSGNIGIDISGTWSGTLQFEGSVNGTNWETVFGFPIDNSNAGVGSTTANGAWRVLGGGLSGVRIRASAFTSGTAVIFMEVTEAASTVRVLQGAATGNNSNSWAVKVTDGTNVLGTSAHPVVVAQGTAGAVASGWPTKITDGTDTVGISTVSGAKALKVDVVQTTGGSGSGGTSSNFSALFPSAGTAAGFTDGTNMQGATVFDLDTGAGFQYTLGVNLRGSSSGGSVEIGTASNPIRIDPTGTTTQPISGSITANIGTTGGLALDSSLTTIDTDIKATQPRDITDRVGRLLGHVTVDNFPGTQPVSGTVTVVQPTAANLNATVIGTVTANIGTTNGLALDTSVTGLQVSQGSTTSGQKGGLTLGAVTTSAPSYTTGQTSPLSLTTSGLLRVDGSGTIQPISGTVTANAGTGTFTVSGTVTANQGTNPWTTDITDRAGRLLGVVYGSQGQQLKQTATNFNTQVEIAVGASLIDPRSIRALTSSDTVTVIQPTGSNLNAVVSGTVTANQGGAPWSQNITQFGGVNISTGTGASGTGIPRVTVSNDSNILATQSGSWTVISNQGTANSAANAWTTKVTDGTNTAAVKAASISPVATDPALVVSLSPNSSAVNSLPTLDTTATGTIVALNGTVSVSTIGYSHIGVQVTGTWSGDLNFQGSIDGGITWINVMAFPITGINGPTSASSALGISDTITNGFWLVNAIGFSTFRMIATSWTSGTATVFLRSTVSSGPPEVQPIIPADSAALDAFSRQRVSEPQSVFSSKQIFDNQPLFWDDQQTSGGSTTSAYQTNQAATKISVNPSVSGVRVRQTFRRFNYESGKGTLITMTGVLVNEGGAGNAAVNRRIGAFDSSNGLFFQMTGTTVQVAVRTFTSGSTVTTTINQANWNLDRLDGTGNQMNPSGILLDVSKVQIFVIDYQWLGTGRVRFGFYHAGQIIYVHQVLNANVSSLVYMSTPNLPLRYEIESVGTGVSGSASLLHICAAVEIEAGFQGIGFQLSADRGASSLATGNNTNDYALLVMRLRSGFSGATIIPTYIGVMTSDSASFRYSVVFNPTVAGTALSYSAITNSAVEVAITDNTNTITGGSTLFADYQISAKNTSASTLIPGQLQLGSSIAGVSDILVLAVQPVPAFAAHYFAAINWQEIV